MHSVPLHPVPRRAVAALATGLPSTRAIPSRPMRPCAPPLVETVTTPPAAAGP